MIGIPGLLILIFGFVSGGAALSFLLGGDVQTSAPILPSARYKLTDVEVNDSCTSFGDYCIRVSCTFTNVGNADGTADVTMALIPSVGPRATETKLARVAVGQTIVVSNDFGSARMRDDHQGECTIR